MQVLEHIDRIARLKQRDVLLLEFGDSIVPTRAKRPVRRSREFDWRKHPSRQKIVRWLDDQVIPWHPCASIASTAMLTAYKGQIYIDLPYDPKEKRCKLLETFLEMPDGTTRWAGVKLWLLPLAMANENAHHDKPGFWRKWAETF